MRIIFLIVSAQRAPLHSRDLRTPSPATMRSLCPLLMTCHAGDLDPASATADNHALAVRSREPSTHEVDHLCGRKAMRPQDRIGAALESTSEQSERAAEVGLRDVMTAAGVGHGVVAAVLGRCPKDITEPAPVPLGAPATWPSHCGLAPCAPQPGFDLILPSRSQTLRVPDHRQGDRFQE
jgi:hypothetical protein